LIKKKRRQKNLRSKKKQTNCRNVLHDQRLKPDRERKEEKCQGQQQFALRERRSGEKKADITI
jgi:hypothetical protein